LLACRRDAFQIGAHHRLDRIGTAPLVMRDTAITMFE
jgi:hypothetical protein